MTIDLGQLLVFLLVMLRMLGMFALNPIFGRTNVPTMINTGLSFFLAVLLFTSMDFPAVAEPTVLGLLLLVVRELAIGFLAGFVIRMFLSIMTIGGEIIDMQLGLSMAKNFDPATNMSVSLTSTMYNSLFVLAFFYTNTHLNLIYMTAQTFTVLPVGSFGLNPYLLYYLPELFSSIMLFSIKLCMPIVVMEVMVTIAVGIIMRIIPQINVFVVNIQFKMLIGFFALVVMVAPVMAYFENLWIICFERIAEAWAFLL